MTPPPASPAAARLRYLRPLFSLFLGIAAVAIVYGRFVWQGRQSVLAAEGALAQGDVAEATRSYLDALRAYVPGSPFEVRALDGLKAQAQAARQANDPLGERRAWEAVRTGLLSTRSLYLPYPTRFAEAQQRLTELNGAAAFPPGRLSAPEIALVPMRGNGPGRAVRPLGSVLAGTLMALIGFAVWVGACVLLIRRGLAGGTASPSAGGRSGAVERQPRRASAGRGGGRAVASFSALTLPLLFVLGFALFLLGLRFG